MKKADEKLVERVIREGHEIADKIRNAKSLDELEEVAEVEVSYSDFTDEEFGTEDYLGSGKECGLSIRLREALYWKQKMLQEESLHDPRTEDIANHELELFEAYLDSKYWVIEIEEYKPPGPPTRQVDKKLAERVVREGYEIADKVRNAKSLDELEKIERGADAYFNFVDEAFGVVGEFDINGNKYCQISFYATMAIETKSRHLRYYNERSEIIGNEGVDDLEVYLDSKDWIHDWLKESAK